MQVYNPGLKTVLTTLKHLQQINQQTDIMYRRSKGTSAINDIWYIILKITKGSETDLIFI